MGVKVRYRQGAWWVFVNHRGKRKAKRVGDEGAARAVAKTIRERLATGDFQIPAKDSPTFQTYADAWLKTGEAARKRKSQLFYEFNLRLHIVPALGSRLVGSIKRADCRELMAACRAKGLKLASMKGVNRTLSAVLSQAVEDAHLSANPAFRMGKYLRDGDAQPKEPIHPFTSTEAHDFLETVKTRQPHWHPFFLCALRTGMRLGELLALEWKDIDTDKRLIHVRRNWDGKRLTTPKNGKGRKVDMSLALSDTLRQLRVDRKKRALQTGEAMPTHVFLMPDLVRLDENDQRTVQQGGRVDGDNMRRRVFKPLMKDAKVPVVRFHDLRHTFASLLIQNGESLAYVKDQCGHSSIQVTVDIYGHLVPGGNRAAVDRLDAVPAPANTSEQSHG